MWWFIHHFLKHFLQYVLKLQLHYIRLWIHNGHPIACPCRKAVECLLWVVCIFIWPCFPTQLSTAMPRSIMQSIRQRKTSKGTPADGNKCCMMLIIVDLHVNIDQFCCNIVTSLQNTNSTHAMASPWEWDIGCILWVQNWVYLLHVSCTEKNYMGKLHYEATRLNNSNINGLLLWVFEEWFHGIITGLDSIPHKAKHLSGVLWPQLPWVSSENGPPYLNCLDYKGGKQSMIGMVTMVPTVMK